MRSRGAGGTAAWHGLAELTPVPPPSARRLDLIADGVTLIELPLQATPPGPPPMAEPVASSAAERLLVWEAERILAGEDPRGSTGAGRAGPEEIITVLTGAGAGLFFPVKATPPLRCLMPCSRSGNRRQTPS